MKKNLITGGAGFLGSHLCEKLLNLGHEVICVDNFYTGAKQNIAHLMDNPYFEIVDAYRLRWLDVPYEAGELKAVVYKGGELLGETFIKTAGPPDQLRLSPDRQSMQADGMDLCYVTIEMVDAEGNVCPLAMDMLEFNVDGAARFMGVANGNQMGHDVFTDETHPLFYGKAVAVLRSIPGQAGPAKLTVSSDSGKVSEIGVSFTQ